MDVNVKEITGVWDSGFSLDKHIVSSTYVGDNEWGHAQFDTVRTDVGEAVFRLKYRDDFTKCAEIAQSINDDIVSKLPFISFIVAMPPSKIRPKQPVQEIALELANIAGKLCIDGLLIKSKSTPQMKDIASRQERIELLMEAFEIDDKVVAKTLPETGYNVLIIDDLYDTGTSLEAATQTLRECDKINQIFVATATRKR
ncbi:MULTISPECIES: ComF family protein [Vibrio]|uniref:ComF family protein n=1 Tax=Vibrio TaxID=662 RepID=UPI001BD3F368|nr:MULTISPECIES: ComF family protein [Vibrio]MBE4031083.1 ComF family protein [Vibrio parahaemolyticus]MBT0070462.1 ComF family protein [Vibrio alginolyticus]MCR9485382.1 ComF family protein [Vibrio alginolyticus]MDW1980162.1 ComF family protein [Vibrio sp. Vb0304]